MTPEQQVLSLQSANHALQLQLADRQEQTLKAIEDKKMLQDRLRDLQNDFETDRDGTMEITKDMTRQYKGMQEELLNRVNTLENTITELKDQLALSRLNLEESKRLKDDVEAKKDTEINEMKLKMDEMTHEFSEMLQSIQTKMRERIEVSNSSFDKEANVPMIRKLEDFNLGAV